MINDNEGPCPACGAFVRHREVSPGVPCSRGEQPVTRAEFEALKKEVVSLRAEQCNCPYCARRLP